MNQMYHCRLMSTVHKLHEVAVHRRACSNTRAAEHKQDWTHFHQDNTPVYKSCLRPPGTTDMSSTNTKNSVNRVGNLCPQVCCTLPVAQCVQAVTSCTQGPQHARNCQEHSWSQGHISHLLQGTSFVHLTAYATVSAVVCSTTITTTTVAVLRSCASALLFLYCRSTPSIMSLPTGSDAPPAMTLLYLVLRRCSKLSNPVVASKSCTIGVTG